MTINQLEIELDGIGHILSDKQLTVPKYQRSYAWNDDNVEELLRDIGEAIRTKAPEYFLGSIVTQGSDGQLEIVDGQQRLATTSIFIAALRDYFHSINDAQTADMLEKDYLFSKDLRTKAITPRLTLNADDNDFYRKAILSKPNDTDREVGATTESHYRIQGAREYCSDYIRTKLTSSHNPSDILFDWVEYIKKQAKVIWVRVPDTTNAFVIFETLNDRGVALSIADLLKNYLFGKAGARLTEAQQNWNKMLGALEVVGGEEVLLTYIRQMWSSENGTTREKDLFVAIKNKIHAVQTAVDFSKNLAESAKLYAAMLNPKSDVWMQYGPSAKNYIEILLYLKLEQFRPLLLAMLKSFSKNEITSALRYLIACSVRFLIVGGSGAGTLEKKYCELAQMVLNKEITTTKQLAKNFNTTVPSDRDFLQSFPIARVSKPYLARYYLRVLERAMQNEKQPELVPNPNADEVNLEHVLPQNPSEGWGHISQEIAESFYNRLGNLALLSQEANSLAGNATFAEKKPILQDSSFKLTQMIGKSKRWTHVDIENRQKKMAELALKAWPID